MAAPSTPVPLLADLQALFITNATQISTNSALIAELQASNEVLGWQNEQIGAMITYGQSLTQLAAVTNFSVISPVTTEVEITWDNNDTRADAYIIDRSTSDDFSTDLTQVFNGVYGSPVTDTGLTSGITYYYRIHSTAPDLDDSSYSFAFVIVL
jgi:hypothetical protein